MPQHQPVPMAAASARSGAPSILNSSGTSATDCPICCTLFRTPKCLACGHSICSSCCQKLLRNDTMIRCPTCRHVTRAAPEGLPTNYALQDTVNQLAAARSSHGSKPYKCEECCRSCTVDDAWLCKRPECLRNKASTAILLCSHCVIARHADHGSANGSTKLESLADSLMKYENVVTDLKRKVDAGLEKQTHRDHKVRKLVVDIDTRVSSLVDVCKRLMQSALDDVKKAEDEYASVQRVADSLNVTNCGFGSLNEIDRLVQDVDRKLKELDQLGQGTISRTEGLLNSLSIELDCLINIGNDEGNGDAAGGNDKKQMAKTENMVVQKTTPLLGNFDANIFLDDDDDDSGEDAGFCTPPRQPQQQQPPAPVALRNSYRNAGQHQRDVDTPVAPVASSSAMNLNANPLHFARNVAQKRMASPSPMYGLPEFYYSSMTKRGPRSTISSIGSDYQRSSHRYGHRK